jgi:hypothetical protein
LLAILAENAAHVDAAVQQQVSSATNMDTLHRRRTRYQDLKLVAIKKPELCEPHDADKKRYSRIAMVASR